MVSSIKRSSLRWLAGFEASTIENIAAVITRVRRPRWTPVAWSDLLTEVPPRGDGSGASVKGTR
jgi:hypothetical protein